MAQSTIIESAWRDDFPILQTQMNGKPLVFLDSAASAQKPQSVIDAMCAVMEKEYANIHRGLYRLSSDLTARFEDVRAKVARFIGAENERCVVFTRNATEAINLVAQSWGRTFLKAGDEIILTAMEHHANIVPWQLLHDQIGIVIKTVPVDESGILDLQALENLLSTRTRLVGVVHISNALGTINPVREINTLVKNFNPEIKVLIDGAQGIVHSPIDVTALGCDFYTGTGHKLYGPTGIGFLYGKEDLLNAMPPYQGGGDMIESVSFEKTTYRAAPHRFEAGTPPIVEVIGLGAAVDYLVDKGMDNIAAQEAALTDFALAQLRAIPGLELLGPLTGRAGIFSFNLKGLHFSDIAMVLDQRGVAVRAGHHCCMPLMQRYGIQGTVRASLGLYSDENDIIQLCAGLRKAQEILG
ncbi:MAG: cysteine desulfurase [Alphaproteobacteria bacterium]|nr:cysteine desulfurase [Alphaproteobacteria bacterium]